jgi:phosphatidylinositol-bisphosphatase
MRIRDSFLTFVNCHLAADENLAEKRNQDFHEIAKRALIPLHSEYEDSIQYFLKNPWVPTVCDSNSDYEFPITAQNPFFLSSGMKYLSLFDCDHLFWMGDLNYRLNLDQGTVKKMLAENRIQDLLDYDQLVTEKKAQRAFVKFKEMPISFAPTYKFNIGTSNYDSSEKKRCPSWCDRILWYENEVRDTEFCISPQMYLSLNSITSSDHKPVGLSCFVPVKRIPYQRFVKSMFHHWNF